MAQSQGLDKALCHLCSRGATICTDGSLHSTGWYIDYISGLKEAVLDGEFSAEDLEAIATVIRHYQKGERR